MALKPPPDRAVYSTSGRVRFFSFLWGVFMGSIAALAVSAAMMGLQYIGFYLLILVPLAAGFAVGGLAMLIVRQSHCRNWLLAGIIGFGMGTLTYLGHYHLDMLSNAGWEHWHRVDILPDYMMMRWEVDTIGDVGKAHGPPNYYMNMIMSAVEWLMMACIAAGMAATAGNKPYAESARCWMVSKSVKFQAGSALAAAQALVTRSHPELIAALVPLETEEPGYAQAEFWICPPHRNSEGDEPVYLTLTEFGPPNKDGNRKSSHVLKFWQLDPPEIAAFIQKFPFLMEWISGGDTVETAEQDALEITEAVEPA
ncbi:hypothetical protein GC163_15835 [bacterium]|nr:hypothetical protein [bacterium]